MPTVRCWPLLALLCIGPLASAQEICDNALDDDGDGLIDLNDSLDCACNRILEVDSAVASLIPNPSFEAYDSLPTSIGQLDRCVGWRQATIATTDYYHALSNPKPGQPMPLPDGDAYVGFIVLHYHQASDGPYYEYLGANLSQPLQAGVSYVLRAYVAGGGLIDTMPFAFVPPWFGPIDLTIFGKPNNVIFPNYDLGCPEPFGWQVLGHATYQAMPTWSVITLAFTPTTDIRSIMIGPPCNSPMDHLSRYMPEDTNLLGIQYPYYLIDKLVLNTQESFIGVISSTGAYCAGDLLLAAHAPEGTVGYQWYRDGVALLGQTGSSLAVPLAMGEGLYTCVARHADGGCLAMDLRVAPEGFTPDLHLQPLVGCQPLEVRFHTTSELASITWHFGDGESATGDTLVHTYLQHGVFQPWVEFTTPSGCSYSATLTDRVRVHPKPEVAIEVLPPGPYEGGQIVELHASGTHMDDLAWGLGNIPPYFMLDRMVYMLTLPQAPGSYPITLYGSTDNGCLDTAVVRLVVPDCHGGMVYVPSAFSPDGSGKNDLLCVYGDCVETMVFRIFDRVGNKVFQTGDPRSCWDGTTNGERLDAAVFVYHLAATLSTGETLERSGNITLVR